MAACGSSRFWLLAALVLGATLARVLSAQQPQAAPPPGQQEYTFTTGTELVLLPVIVRGRDGAHVSGISKEAFTITQEGAKQPIAFFEEIREGVPRKPTPLRLAPGVFTNVRGENQPNNLVLVLLDMLNTTPEAHAQNRRELLQGLARSMNEQTPTALLILNEGGVRVVHDFTTSPALLLSALDRVVYRREDTAGTQDKTASTAEVRDPTPQNLAGQPAPSGAAGIAARLDQMTNDINAYVEGLAAPIATYKRGAVIASTLEALEAIARSYAGVPGRKSLLWVTAGFPFEAIDDSGRIGSGSVAHAYQKSLRALTNANVALYPIDIRGLINVGFGASPTRSARRARDEAPVIDAQYGEMMSRISNMENLAETTGGRAFYNTNDVGGAFQTAARDSSAYYLLGFYLDRSQSKPGWHKLKVKVDRDKVDVRAREGFFVGEGEADPAEARRQDITTALHAPIESTQVPILLRWNHIEPTPAGRKAVFDVDLPAGAVSVDAQNRLNLDFIVVATSNSGEKAGDFSQNYTATLSADGLQRIARSGVTYSNHILVPPGRYRVRVVVRDNVSGRTGSLLAPLTAP